MSRVVRVETEGFSFKWFDERAGGAVGRRSLLGFCEDGMGMGYGVEMKCEMGTGISVRLAPFAAG